MFNIQIVEIFPNIFLLLISNLIQLWSETILYMISVFLYSTAFLWESNCMYIGLLDVVHSLLICIQSSSFLMRGTVTERRRFEMPSCGFGLSISCSVFSAFASYNSDALLSLAHNIGSLCILGDLTSLS